MNLGRATIGLVPPLWEPPARPVFSAHPAGRLTIVNGPQGPRLLLTVTGPVTDDIMVFGQAPCSAGRNKRSNVAYLIFRYGVRAEETGCWVQEKLGGVEEGSANILKQRQ